MEADQKQQYQSNNGQCRTIELPVIHEQGENQEIKEIVPGVPIVRSNTPRPHSLGFLSPTSKLSPSLQQSEPVATFPSKAPSTLPLPETPKAREEGSITPQISFTSKTKPHLDDPQEFTWLFEYGLEMDSTLMNSPERLDGLALLYGPAVLKGYTIVFGSIGMLGKHESQQGIITLVPDTKPETEVWGILYRIPGRLTIRIDNEPSRLDTVHAAGTAWSLFRIAQVSVHETYRNREIACVTYIATDAARQQLHLLSLEQGGAEMLLAQRLVEIAKKQKLPEKYLNLYTASTSPTTPYAVQEHTMTPLRAEHHTEPLLNLQGESSKPSPTNARSTTPQTVQRGRWLTVFAIYLVIIFLSALTFAILQGLGFGRNVLTDNFAPLGVPWLVLVYGLLGGCVSCIAMLGQPHSTNPPLYVIIIWFTRPYIGTVLAVLTYLLLTSGFFIIGEGNGQHSTFLLFIGALAGLCEGSIFFRRR